MGGAQMDWELYVALLALAISLASAWFARVTANIEKDRDIRQQAAGVAAWCVGADRENDPQRAEEILRLIHYKADFRRGQSQPNFRGRIRGGIVVSNRSEAPVYDVYLQNTYAYKKGANPNDEPPLTLNVVPPGTYFIRRLDDRESAAIAEEKGTGLTYDWAFPVAFDVGSELEGIYRPVMNLKEWTVRWMHFLDSSDQRWCRDHGRLRKWDGGDPPTIEQQSSGRPRR